jgi:predicted metal-binding membrane protein
MSQRAVTARQRPASLAAPAVALSATLALAAAGWLVALMRMRGMDMGVATDLGPLRSFLATWAPMMAAMMLPGAAPAVVDRARGDAGVRGALLFAASYVAVWTAVGLLVHAVYRPHGALAAGVIVAAAALYELTPLKRRCRARCRAGARSGLEYGAWCVGSSIGLMAVAVALGPMSVTWMALVAAVVLAQKLLPIHRTKETDT